jgi:hypothetical protein
MTRDWMYMHHLMRFRERHSDYPYHPASWIHRCYGCQL